MISQYLIRLLKQNLINKNIENLNYSLENITQRVEVDDLKLNFHLSDLQKESVWYDICKSKTTMFIDYVIWCLSVSGAFSEKDFLFILSTIFYSEQ